MVDSYAPMAYIPCMLIVETPVFTRRISKLMSDEEYRALQNYLLVDPTVGMSGRGKRGGACVIYYYFVDRSTILLLIAFSKNERADLTKPQLKILKRLVEEELK